MVFSMHQAQSSSSAALFLSAFNATKWVKPSWYLFFPGLVCGILSLFFWLALLDGALCSTLFSLHIFFWLRLKNVYISMLCKERIGEKREEETWRRKKIFFSLSFRTFLLFLALFCVRKKNIFWVVCTGILEDCYYYGMISLFWCAGMTVWMWNKILVYSMPLAWLNILLLTKAAVAADLVCSLHGIHTQNTNKNPLKGGVCFTIFIPWRIFAGFVKKHKK